MGGKTTKSTQTTSIPPEVLARYNSVNAQAQQAASTPFQEYKGEFVAPLNDTQNAGIANTNAAATQSQQGFKDATGVAGSSYAASQPYNQGATAYALAGGNAVDPSDVDASAINKYMNPYLNSVLGSTSALLQQDNAKAQSGALGSAISSGAFGGDRAGIGAANLQQQQNLANANIYSNIASQGFNTALGAAQQQQGVHLSADQANRTALQQTGTSLANIGQQTFAQGQGQANTLAGLASGAQTSALQGADAQLKAGGVQQATEQAKDSAVYNQFLQKQSYPFQTAQFVANIAEGTGAQSGQTDTRTAPGSIFSDERLKEDIRPIGKTNDGQTIYSYRYKGDHTYQIGLLAQEVERHHPEAVGLAGGYKTVNYKHATEDAERHRRALGGGMPYSSQEGLDIPNEQQQHGKISAANMSDGDSGAGDLNTIMNMGKFAMMLSTGGRAGRADGGGVDDDDIPLPDLNDLDNSSLPLSTGLAAGKPPAAGKTPAATAQSPGLAPPPTGLAPPNKPETHDPDDIVSAIAKAEGTGKNPKSSARGAFQFTDDTFVGMFKQMYPDRAKNMDDDQIKALRNTPEGDQLSTAMGPVFTHQNMRKLASAGHAPTAGNTYLAHFLGPQGAIHILSTPAQTPLENVLSQKVIDANPKVMKGKRVGDLLTWASNTVGKFMPRSERAFGGRAGFDDGGHVGDGMDDSDAPAPSGLAGGAPPPADDNTLQQVTVDAPKGDARGLKPPAANQVQEAPELLNRKLPNVQMAPDPDEKPKLPKDPNIIDGITKFAKNTFDGIGGAATRMGESLNNPKGTDDQYGVHHGVADYILPILTGLGAAGADRSGSVGGAIAAGLGAGAGAYQHQRDYGQKQQQINTQRISQNARIAEMSQNAAARNVELFNQAWLENPQDANTVVSRYDGSVHNKDDVAAMRANYTDNQWGMAKKVASAAANPNISSADMMAALGSLAPNSSGFLGGGAGGASSSTPAAPVGGTATPATGQSTTTQTVTPQPASAGTVATPAAHPAAQYGAAAPSNDTLATGKPVSAYIAPMPAGHSGEGVDPAALEAQAHQILSSKYATPESTAYAQNLLVRADRIKAGANDPAQQAAIANATTQRTHYAEVGKSYNGAAAEYAATSQVQQMIEDSVIKARTTTNLNEQSGEISHLIGTLTSYLPNNPRLHQVFAGLEKINADQHIVDKDAARLNLLQSAASSLGTGAPAKTLGVTAAAIPDSRAPPETAREALVQMRAQRLQQRAFFDDWAKDGPKIMAANANPEAYAADWRNDPRHRLELYQKVANSTGQYGVPHFAGAAPEDGGPKPDGTVGGKPVWKHADGQYYRQPPG